MADKGKQIQVQSEARGPIWICSYQPPKISYRPSKSHIGPLKPHIGPVRFLISSPYMGKVCNKYIISDVFFHISPQDRYEG